MVAKTARGNDVRFLLGKSMVFVVPGEGHTLGIENKPRATKGLLAFLELQGLVHHQRRPG